MSGGRHVSISGDHSRCVDAGRITFLSAERSKVGHYSVFPDERTGSSASISRAPHDLSGVVDAFGNGVASPQGPQRRGDAVLPDKAAAADLCAPNHLPHTVELVRRARRDVIECGSGSNKRASMPSLILSRADDMSARVDPVRDTTRPPERPEFNQRVRSDTPAR